MLDTIRPYIQITRVDHWFKNIFMVLGILVAFLYQPGLFEWSIVPTLAVAVFATCLVASSNYVLNELLDAKHDREHPIKKHRMVPSGRIATQAAILLWLLLAAIGFALGFWLNVPFALAAISLWVMGCVYNIPPIRAKEVAYLDVITESVNNPIRLLLGWFALIDDRLPPLSLLLAYWALGAFLMGTKRFAEMRMFDDREAAARYRRSFRHYTEDSLLVSMFFYSAACSLLGGLFIVRCKLELILFVPFAAGFLAYYLKLGLEKDSPVQNPEKLLRTPRFATYTLICFLVLVALTFVEIPVLYELFNFEAPTLPSLWVFGQR